ncbi:MAG: hypothetical protein ACFFG0_40600 [Candidatus Thorarchaeota archaeon]
MKESQISITCLSGDAIFSFDIDSEGVSEYDRKILNHLQSATGHFNKCVVYRNKIKKPETLDDPKSKYHKLLVTQNKEGLKKIRKIKKLLSKDRSFSKEDIKEIHKGRERIGEKLEKVKLSQEAKDSISEELEKGIKILESKGGKGLNDYIISKIEELEDVISNPIKGWKWASDPLSILIAIGICALIFLIIFGPLIFSILFPARNYLADLDRQIIHYYMNYQDECERENITNEAMWTYDEYRYAVDNWGYVECSHCLAD